MSLLLFLTGGSGSSTQTLTPGVHTNAQTFFAPAVTTANALEPARYDSAQAFFPPTLTTSVALQAALTNNTQTFYSPVVAQAGAAQTLLPGRYENGPSFFSPSISQTLIAARFDNGPTFYAPTVETSGVEPAARHEIDIIDFEPKLWWQRRPKAIPEPVARAKVQQAVRVIRQVAEQAAEQGTEPTKKDLRQAIEPLEMPGFDYLALYQQVSLLVNLERQRDAEEQARQLAQAVILAAQQRAQDDEDELILLLAA